ncbi:Papain-like cysteine peptidase superfamily [Arabidopsis thaliana x Arabidopsis arenosa]|uniref:Papain-like cysteine peptidase superfamily n=1 Tax=Arabidopsis thaliana x Arabidopsis arenosa TaxID=1240361 RepID=A0A8T2APL2_9BRAS|nr:Papain-like cysteine peptidase superfamily [Arabidopsis thaliana x Arabidopsis arenosa]
MTQSSLQMQKSLNVDGNLVGPHSASAAMSSSTLLLPSKAINELLVRVVCETYCDRVQLQPFGLVNLGNSCYADAFLQCLALTRLLISYLIRGLHSKTCEEATVSVPQSKDKNIRCSISNTINPDRRKSHEGSAPLLQQREGSQKPALMMDLLELRTKNLTVKMKLFDAHCHLQDKRVIDEASQLISAAFSCRCYQFRSQWNLRERLGLGERDGRDVSFCCTLHRTTSLNLLIPLYLATKLQEMKSILEREEKLLPGV